MQIKKYTFGMGDRFAHQGKAQLQAVIHAKTNGLALFPVWNKSFREHSIVGSAPGALRAEADAAVAALQWSGDYYVDADHINLKTVDGFLAGSNFYTLDVADYVGQSPEAADLEAFVQAHLKYTGTLRIPGIESAFEVSEESLRAVAGKFLAAIRAAKSIYQHIITAKGEDSFVTEISVDETDSPQTPIELFLILAMIAAEGIPVQTIAPKFTGRFNKGVDYVGDLATFEKEFDEDLHVIAFAISEFSLPETLKLSVHSGSDKFSIYPIIRKLIRRHNAGLHVKTATTTYAYDELGQMSSETNHLSETTSYTYDQFGQVLTITYPDHVASTNERIQTLTYTSFGQLDTQTGAETYDVDYGYDLAGNRITMTTYYGSTPTSATTTWVYNARNQMDKKIYADNSDYDYVYDDSGNLKERTDALNQTTKYYYNQFNNLTIIDYSNDGDVQFTYDSAGRRESMTEGGSTAGGVYSGGTLSQEWTYDTASRVTLHEQHTVGYQVEYDYTDESNRDTRTMRPIGTTNNWTLNYGYDAAGRMDEILDSEVNATTPFSYTYKSNANLLEDTVFPSGAKLKRTYDTQGRLTKIETLNQSATAIDSYAYSYNAAGLRQDETLLDTTVRDFTYDERRQLTDAEVASSTYDYNWLYDPIGNRLSYDDDGTTTTYAPNNLNEYTSISTISPNPAYDANGSLTELDGVTYVWDDENRLIEVYDSAKRSVYTYDGLGKRIRKREYTGSPGSWSLSDDTWYVYDDKLVVVDLDSSKDPVNYYTRGLDLTQTLNGAGGVGSLLAMTEAGDSYFYGYDGNGNVTKLIDNADAVEASYSYSPFGGKLSYTGTIASTNPYQFSTKEYEADWDLNYYLYRFYSPSLGRWLSRDPIGETGGLNLYGMVKNDPINKWDFLGLVANRCCEDECSPLGEISNAHIIEAARLPGGYPYSPDTISGAFDGLSGAQLTGDVASGVGLGGGLAQGAQQAAEEIVEHGAGEGMGGGLDVEDYVSDNFDEISNNVTNRNGFAYWLKVKWTKCESKRCPRGPASNTHNVPKEHEAWYQCPLTTPGYPGLHPSDSRLQNKIRRCRRMAVENAPN